MAKSPDKRIGKSQTKTKEFVVVTLTEDHEQAENYQAILRANDIPASIKEQQDSSDETQNSYLAVVVPEEHIDEAHVIIESQDAYDDFYDITLDNDDFESDYLDDEF